MQALHGARYLTGHLSNGSGSDAAAASGMQGTGHGGPTHWGIKCPAPTAEVSLLRETEQG